MSDIKSLIIGIIGGLIVLGISNAYKHYKKKTIREDIQFLEFEKQHLGEMKKSSVEMNRSSFRAIFFLFLLMGVANLIPELILQVSNNALNGLSSFISMIVWGLFTALAIKFWRRYGNLKNFKEANKRMEEKLDKLKSKLESS